VNLESFQISEAIVHDVPRGGDEEQAPILTDAPIALDGPLRAYFRRKILKSLGLRGLEVVVDPDGDACVRDGVAEIVADRNKLVPVSRRIAEHLHAVQTGPQLRRAADDASWRDRRWQMRLRVETRTRAGASVPHQR
jgi:hypothetical protein